MTSVLRRLATTGPHPHRMDYAFLADNVAALKRHRRKADYELAASFSKAACKVRLAEDVLLRLSRVP